MAVGETALLVPVTAPMELSRLRLVAPVTVHASVLEAPLEMVAGLVVKLEMTGFCSTVTVACAVTEPARLVAVSVYVVVAEGVTSFDVVPVTTPTALSMLRLLAPETDHESVVLAPTLMFAGLAAKLVIVGSDTTVTVAVANVDPAALVAVSVYVVVAAGVTTLLVPVTAPTP